jgi:hypothetical protein
MAHAKSDAQAAQDKVRTKLEADQAQLKEAAEHEAILEGSAKISQADCDKSTSRTHSAVNAAKAKLKADVAADIADEAELEQAKEDEASTQTQVDKDKVQEQAESEAEDRAKQAVEQGVQQVTQLQKLVEQEQAEKAAMKRNANLLISTAADEAHRSEAAEHSAAEAQATVVGKEPLE